MPRRRLGVAVLLPEPLATEVDALRRAAGAAEAVGRIPPHLTLVPPVNVREVRFDDAVGVLQEAAARHRPFRLTLGPSATFLPVNPVVYLRVDGDLAALRELRNRVFVEPLARPLTWPFEPHVTLLETGDAAHVERASAALAGYRTELVVERVHLLEEWRGADRVRRWRPVADATLASRAVVGRGGLELVTEVVERPDPAAVAWQQAGWEAESRSHYGADWAPDRPLAVVARREQMIAGVAEGKVRGTEAYLARLLVDPTARGEGIGGHLLAAFTAAAVERGCDRVTLRTLAGGPAEAFYRDRGYETLAHLPAWRFGHPFVQLVRRLA